jgi:hypothetical protein
VYNWVEEISQEKHTMGLDISVVRTPKVFDLHQIYAIHNAVEEGFNWYLGDDTNKREEKYEELREKVLCLNRQKVLDTVTEPKELVDYLNGMNSNEFALSLAWVVGSVKKHEKGNTHLFFDSDLFPGVSLFDGISWNLHDLFADCASDKNPNPNPNGDFLMELDPAKVKELAKKWNKWSFVLKTGFAKWIGFFLPETGERIRLDAIKDMGLKDDFVDFSALEYYRRSLNTVANGIQDGDRVWLISSY